MTKIEGIYQERKEQVNAWANIETTRRTLMTASGDDAGHNTSPSEQDERPARKSDTKDKNWIVDASGVISVLMDRPYYLIALIFCSVLEISNCHHPRITFCCALAMLYQGEGPLFEYLFGCHPTFHSYRSMAGRIWFEWTSTWRLFTLSSTKNVWRPIFLVMLNGPSYRLSIFVRSPHTLIYTRSPTLNMGSTRLWSYRFLDTFWWCRMACCVALSTTSLCRWITCQ